MTGGRFNRVLPFFIGLVDFPCPENPRLKGRNACYRETATVHFTLNQDYDEYKILVGRAITVYAFSETKLGCAKCLGLRRLGAAFPEGMGKSVQGGIKLPHSKAAAAHSNIDKVLSMRRR